MSILCPHCGADNVAGAAFCESCGKALPLAKAAGPRVVTADALPASAAGQQLLGEQLQKTTKRAANTLLTVGIIQIVIGGILCLLIANMARSNASSRSTLMTLVAVYGVLGAVFLGLSFWARRSPLPAAIIGLVLYATLIVVNVITTISHASTAPPGTANGGLGGTGVGYIDILIIVFLARGIKAAIDHRKLERGAAASV